MLLSFCLLFGLVACESETETYTDPGQVDAVLSEYAAERAEVIAAIGDARGIELSSSPALDRAAARHALELAGHRTSTHLGADGSSPVERIREAGARMRGVREFIFRIEGDPEDLGRRAAHTWLAPFDDNAVLTEPCTHAAVAFAPLEEGGSVGVLLLAQR
jgi:uncharacterized protein YkwD